MEPNSYVLSGLQRKQREIVDATRAYEAQIAQGEPGSINSVFAPTLVIHSRAALNSFGG